MRSTLKVGAVVVVLLVAVSYSPAGKIYVSEWRASLTAMLTKLAGGFTSTTADSVTVSKWVDAKGVTHYENRPVEGAKTLEVDPNTNVLPPAPVIKLPETKPGQTKTMNAEVQELQKKKDAYYESVINN